MAECLTYQDEDDVLDYTPEADITAGEVIQLADGRAAWAPSAIASGVQGSVAVCGLVTVAKTSSIVILDGGRVFWDHSANKAHFKSVSDRDFYLGVAVGDAASAATTMVVALNVIPQYKIDLARDPYLTSPTGTQALGGFLPPAREGGAIAFKLTGTNEVQKADALSVERFAPGANAIFEVAFRMPNGGSGSASDFSLGLANATHATDADSITDSIFFHMDGGSTTIYAECDDGTNETAATTTATTFTAGTALSNRVEGWIDCRDLSSIKFYLDGVRVASGTTFSVAAMTNSLGILAHVEKTTGTETADMTVDWARVRIAQK